ncbi:hypothetical protein BKA93DRAFT_746673 [Sparassis latifolia]
MWNTYYISMLPTVHKMDMRKRNRVSAVVHRNRTIGSPITPIDLMIDIQINQALRSESSKIKLRVKLQYCQVKSSLESNTSSSKLITFNSLQQLCRALNCGDWGTLDKLHCPIAQISPQPDRPLKFNTFDGLPLQPFVPFPQILSMSNPTWLVLSAFTTKSGKPLAALGTKHYWRVTPRPLLDGHPIPYIPLDVCDVANAPADRVDLSELRVVEMRKGPGPAEKVEVSIGQALDLSTDQGNIFVTKETLNESESPT